MEGLQRKRMTVEEEEMGAVVGFVAEALAPELYIELQTAFHFTEACFKKAKSARSGTRD
jgi:hypothetical protein